MSWEYKAFEIKPKKLGIFSKRYNMQEVEHALNELGRMNWELIHVTPPDAMGLGSSFFTFMMKRKK